MAQLACYLALAVPVRHGRKYRDTWSDQCHRSRSDVSPDILYVADGVHGGYAVCGEDWIRRGEFDVPILLVKELTTSKPIRGMPDGCWAWAKPFPSLPKPRPALKNHQAPAAAVDHLDLGKAGLPADPPVALPNDPRVAHHENSVRIDACDTNT